MRRLPKGNFFTVPINWVLISFYEVLRKLKSVSEWMFLAFENIFSDHTFYAQSQIVVEQFPNFRQNLPAFVREWQLWWPLVSHDPSGSCDTSWRMTAGMSRPVSLFSSGFPWWILMVSLILLLDTWPSLSNILASFRLHLCPVMATCSPTAVLGCRPAVCSLYLVPRLVLNGIIEVNL